MMQKLEPEIFCPESQKEWRQWLQENHKTKPSVWLVYYKKKTNRQVLNWSQAVDEALCFGWIDSTARPIDDEKYMQFFSKRKPNSAWSKINKAKVERLIDQQLMAPAGYESIELAKQNGSWIFLDEVEELIIPQELEKEFEMQPEAKDYFLSLSKSVRKSILHWLLQAKKPDTRKNRIDKIVDAAAQKLKPEQFR